MAEGGGGGGWSSPGSIIGLAGIGLSVAQIASGGLFGKGGDDDSATAAYAAQLHASARNIDSTLSRQVEQAKFADAYFPTLLQQAGFSREQTIAVLKQNRAELAGASTKIPGEVWGSGAGAGITWAGAFAADEFGKSPLPDVPDIASTLTKPYDKTFVDYKAEHPMETSPEYQNALKLGERAQDRQFAALGLTNSGKSLEARAFLLSDLSAKEDVLQEGRQQYGYATEQTNNLQKRVNEGRLFQQQLATAGLDQQAQLVGQQLDAQQNIVAQQSANAQALQQGTQEFQSNLLDKQLANNSLYSSLGFALNSFNADRMFDQNNRLIDTFNAKGTSSTSALPRLSSLGTGSYGNYSGLPNLTSNYSLAG